MASPVKDGRVGASHAERLDEGVVAMRHRLAVQGGEASKRSLEGVSKSEVFMIFFLDLFDSHWRPDAGSPATATPPIGQQA